MNTLLITPAEAWELAFPGTDYVRPETISKSQIEAAQLKYLRPVLGGLYEVLDQAHHGAFVAEYLKSPLAWYVRSLVLDEMAASVGSLGVLQGKTPFGSPLAPQQVHSLRKQARGRGDVLLDRAVKYVEEHAASFPEYDPRANIRRRISIQGGIALEKSSLG